MKKKVLFAAAFMLATVGAYAQGNGIAGITEATNMVTSYFDPGTKLIYAVGRRVQKSVSCLMYMSERGAR